jgi:hypothetical protein
MAEYEIEVVSPDFPRIVDAAALPEVLIIGEPAHISKYPLGPNPVDHAAPDVTVCSALTALHSRPFAQVQELAEFGHLSAGSPREELWGDVFGPLAQCVNNVAILDRFLFKDVKAGVPGAVVWLLDRINEYALPNTTVTLYGGLQDQYSSALPHSSAEALLAIRQLWTPGAPNKISRLVVAGAEWPPNSLPHDRHIRFGRVGAINLPGGFERLNAVTIWDSNGVNWDFRTQLNRLDRLEADERKARTASSISDWPY